MRIIATGFLSVVFLGATISDGWCPEPADLDAPLSGSTGATGADRPNDRPPKMLPPGSNPLDPENMTRGQRQQLLSRERAAGRVTNDQEAKNFLETGNPRKSWTPPERKPLVKPASMSDAQWQRILATRAQPQNYVRGTPGSKMEWNAKQQGGAITTMPAPATATTPAPAKTANPTPPKSAAAASLDAIQRNETRKPEQFKKFPGSASTPSVERARITSPAPTSSAMDRLGGGPSHGVSSGASGGGKGTVRSAVTMKDANRPVPQAQPRAPSGPDRPITYGGCAGCGTRDTFRQPR